MSIETELLASMRAVHQQSYKFPLKKQVAGKYATYQRVGGRGHATLHSGVGAPRARFQIDVWSSAGGEDVRTTAEAMKVRIADDLKVGEIVDNPDDYEVDTTLHRASFDVVVWER